MRLGDKEQQIMTNEEYVGYLENIRDMFIVGCERCEGDALKYQQRFISALNFAITYIKSNLEGKEETNMKDKIKQAVADEFKYRASHGRPIYTMEEVIYIVCEVIDEVAFEENEAESQERAPDLDMQMCAIKGDLKYLSEKVNKLSSLLAEQKIKGDKAVRNEQ